MFNHLRLTLAVFISISSANAVAANLANVQSIPLTFTCAAQGGEYSRQFVDRMTSPSSFGPNVSSAEATEYLQKMQTMLFTSAWARCVKKRQWISDTLCTAVMEESMKERGIDMGPIFSKYGQEISELKQVADYFEIAFPRGGTEPKGNHPCPE